MAYAAMENDRHWITPPEGWLNSVTTTSFSKPCTSVLNNWYPKITSSSKDFELFGHLFACWTPFAPASATGKGTFADVLASTEKSTFLFFCTVTPFPISNPTMRYTDLRSPGILFILMALCTWAGRMRVSICSRNGSRVNKKGLNRLENIMPALFGSQIRLGLRLAVNESRTLGFAENEVREFFFFFLPICMVYDARGKSYNYCRLQSSWHKGRI